MSTITQSASFTLVVDDNCLQVRATCRSNADIRALIEALAKRLEQPFAPWSDHMQEKPSNE